MPDSSTPRPILLDTDIGTDIDDVYALILAATSPEFDLKAVTVVNNDVGLRAKLARCALDLLGRPEIPVYLGATVSLTPGERRGWGGHEGIGIELPDHFEGEIYSAPDAAQAIAEQVQAAAEKGSPITLCPIGAMTNIALALRRFPEILPMVSEIVAMASDFRGVGSENARIEHNIACDSVAADIVLRSGLPVTLIGLNVTEQTAMTQEEVDALKAIGGPLAQFLTGMHEIWFQRIRRNHSAMHDGLTMALMLDPSLMTLETYVVEVITHGAKTGSTVYSAPQEGRLVCQVATTVDAPRYHALLQGRVQSAVRASLSA